MTLMSEETILTNLAITTPMKRVQEVIDLMIYHNVQEGIKTKIPGDMLLVLIGVIAIEVEGDLNEAILEAMAIGTREIIAAIQEDMPITAEDILEGIFREEKMAILEDMNVEVEEALMSQGEGDIEVEVM